MTTRRTVRFAGLAALTAAAAFSLTAFQSGSTEAHANPAPKGTVSISHSTGDDSAGSAKVRVGSPAGTETLADGSTARISKLGDLHYRAEIVSDGSVVATLDADQHDAGLDANGMYVVLGVDGEIHSWMGGEHHGPGTYELAGGWTAEVTELGELHYRADILDDEGAVVATLDADEQDAGLDANDSYIVLSTRGVISSSL
ncbi:hypothetical protein ACFUIW_05660 [Streptomyces sp. NPDC057245]|uniref:hypothetical protein n=1 Tax=Streptomyces TaxID=1883 RepID=UPI001C1E7BCB|nr:hypothetical protein [Streptomyces sp. A108]MBU6530723.1 hypothetical protein [Streptomyces sp. A108]